MRYRAATLEDAALLGRMNHALIRDEGHRNPMTVEELGERMRGWLAAEYRAVAFEDGEGVAGYALFKVEPEWVYLRQFFVVQERRRGGVGRAAVEWLVGNVWGEGTRVRLDVLVGNPAGVAFWRSVGFLDYCVTMERGRDRVE